MKRFTTISLVIIGFIILLMYLGAWASSADVEQAKINPKESFSKKDKIPYGTYILFEQLKDLFPNSKISITKKTASDYLSERYYKNYNRSDSTRTYIFINNEINFSEKINKFDAEDHASFSLLKSFVQDGNHVFIAAQSFGEELQDFFDFEVRDNIITLDDSLYHSVSIFKNPHLQKNNPVNIQSISVNDYFELPENTNALVHATDNRNHPILIEVQYGEDGGSFILCTTPFLFTNYYLLKDKQNYAKVVAPILSLLPKEGVVIWDEYYKVQNLEDLRQNKQGDWMRFIRSQPPLAWGFYLTIVLGILYMLSAMKRTQRIIPVVTPLRNSTLDFAETIGRLYFQSQDHSNIAEKKIRFFLEFVRNHFYMKTQNLDAEFCEILANKSLLSQADIQEIVKKIHAFRSSNKVSEKELQDFSATLDKFYEKAK